MSQSITKISLKRGCQGQDVLDLQCALAAASVYADNFDGVFGGSTEAALRAFQNAKSLSASGVFDPETAAILDLKTAEPALRPFRLTADLVIRLFPGTPFSNVQANLPSLLHELAEVALDDKLMVAVALATIRVEAASFLPISEMPSVFNTSPGGKPFNLYDHRAALGNIGPPDGANFRGRGFTQLTGRANFLQFSKAIGLGDQLVTNPLMAHKSGTAAKILAAFLKTREGRIRTALAQGRLADVRRFVNGGSNGLTQFAETFSKGLQLLPDRATA